jgi:Homeodomain-like domain
MDEAGNLTMSRRELDRLTVLGRVLERRLTQSQAAQQLGLSVRQVERLCRRFRADGPAGLVSRKRGRASARQLPASLRRQVLGLVSQHYADFGPTLASEKLSERHGIELSRETLRQWMIEGQLWLPHARRLRRVHQSRRRRASRGELVQIDGSPHAWFEDRGPQCTLLVYVDDATSELMELRFVASESAFDYFAATKQYLLRYGRPVALYSDKASIFRAVASEAKHTSGLTQFSRALSELNIDLICANTPQAKGRVERSNQTLQDRLVKELRLHGISTPDQGNAYVPQFMEAYNRRFGKEPLSPQDAHRPLRPEDDLERIFSWQEERRLTANLELSYKHVRYLVEPNPRTLALRGQRCRVHEYEDGRVEVWHEDERLRSRALWDPHPHVQQGAIVANKRLSAVLEQIRIRQQDRDRERLANPKLSLRHKQRIRQAQQDAERPVPGLP